MLNWLFNKQKTSTPSYRIRYIPDHGFIPEVWVPVMASYRVIEKSLTTGVYECSVTSSGNLDNFHNSEKSAGKTLNAYVSLHTPGNNVVWTSKD